MIRDMLPMFRVFAYLGVAILAIEIGLGLNL